MLLDVIIVQDKLFLFNRGLLRQLPQQQSDIVGLDQYAYAALRADQRSDFNRTGEFTDDDFVNKTVPKPINIAYWRKHPNLQGWMERLWWRKTGVPLSEDDQFLQNKYPPGDFNGIELELTWEDLDQLEQDILSNRVSKLDTKGFFFGTVYCINEY